MTRRPRFVVLLDDAARQGLRCVLLRYRIGRRTWPVFDVLERAGQVAVAPVWVFRTRRAANAMIATWDLAGRGRFRVLQVKP